MEDPGSICEDGLLTPIEAADFLGIGPSSLYTLVKSGALPVSRVFGRSMSIPKRALVAYAQARLVVPGGDAA